MLHAQSLSLNVAYGLMPAPEDYPRALEVLAEWPEARASRLRFLCDFGVALELGGAAAAALPAGAGHGGALGPGRVEVAREPAPGAHRAPEAAGSAEPGDRALFLAALSGADEAAACFALEGLLALDESGPAGSSGSRPCSMPRIRWCACARRRGCCGGGASKGASC
ncbi:hypothetical protein ACN28S_34900 [Cystobacter fuscus]